MTLMTGILLALLIVFTVFYARSPWRKLPPSPRWTPIIGNAFQLLDINWLTSKDCKNRFGEYLLVRRGKYLCSSTVAVGEVMYLDAAGTPTIVFNSLKPAVELLERRSNNFSDRPRLIMAHEILSQGILMAFMNFNAM